MTIISLTQLRSFLLIMHSYLLIGFFVVHRL